jgi:mannose-6-phosphate isomerase-like protein (cupin superfamily)
MRREHVTEETRARGQGRGGCFEVELSGAVPLSRPAALEASTRRCIGFDKDRRQLHDSVAGQGICNVPLAHPRGRAHIYVLEGEVVLRTSAGEQVLRPGMCAGFPAGVGDGHQLINRSELAAMYLEVSNRDAEDTAYYTDADVDLTWNPPRARGEMTRKNGAPY